MSSRFRSQVHSLLALAAIGWCTTARAEPSTADKAAAETLFDEGKRLMAAQKFADACPKLADSNRLDPGVGTLLNLGRCYRELGRTASAWSTYREAAALARAGGQSDREQLARTESAALEASLTRLLIQVPPEVAAQGIEVRRNGELVPASLWGLATPVDPGTHVIEARAAGKNSIQQRATTGAAGSTVTVTIPALESAGPIPAGTPAPNAQATDGGTSAPAHTGSAASRDAPGTGRGSATAVVLVVGGVGLAAAVTGSVFLALGRSEDEKARALCREGPENRRCANTDEYISHGDHLDAAKDNYLIGYIGVGVGAAAVVTSAVLFFVGGSSDSATSARPLELVAGVQPGGASVGLSGSF